LQTLYPYLIQSGRLWGTGLLGVVATLAMWISDGFDAHVFHQETYWYGFYVFVSANKKKTLYAIGSVQKFLANKQ